MLADLHRRLHFLVLAVDADAGQYRYHDLFAEFLRRRLAAADPGRVAAQHRRAASVVLETPRRIEHLLAAGDDEQAADVIEATGRGVLGEPGALQRVSAWIDRLPPEVVEARPWLRLLAGVAAMDRGDMSAAVALLESLLEAMQADDDYLGPSRRGSAGASPTLPGRRRPAAACSTASAVDGPTCAPPSIR